MRYDGIKHTFEDDSIFPKKFREPLLIIFIFVVYFITAKLGLMMDAVSGFATLVWAPSGIAIASVLLLGNRVWPAIAWAAFVVNYQNDANLFTAGGIAIGNTLEAIIGSYLLNHYFDFNNNLNRQKDTLSFIVVSLLSAAVSATIGSTSIALSSINKWEGFLSTWFAWWMGDLIGILIIVPLILSWVLKQRPYKISTGLCIELAFVFFLLITITYMIFGFPSSQTFFLLKFPYMLVPFIIWASVRFFHLGSSSVVFVISLIAIWGTSRGYGPFTPGVFRENLFVVHGFLGIFSTMGMVLSSVILERKLAVENVKKIGDELRSSHAELEKKVSNRTLELKDINDQLEKRVEERTSELITAQGRKTAMFEASLDCIITVDKHGMILEFNDAAEKTFMRKRADVIGKEMANIIIPERFREMHRQGMAKYLKTGSGPVLGKRMELSAIRSDGKEFPVELSIIALELNGEPFFTGFLRDITEQKKTAKDLEDAKNNAEVATQTKSAFLANMSHEIRTPLGAILGFSELVIDPTISASDKLNFVESIQRNGELLSNIINDILDLSKVEAGKLEMEVRETSLNEVLIDLMSLLKLRAEEKGIELHISYDQSIPNTINTDSLRLRQILINIVGNAIKFTEQGSVKVFVKISENNKLAFVVEDTGYGISEGQSEKLFQSFTQADVSTKRKFGGTGLGLVLSKRLAKLLGGDLVLTKSELGKGSTFTITIDPGPLNKDSLALQKDSTFYPSTPNPRLDGITVLLVEDSTDNQLLISRLLKNSGAQVEIADNGKIGLEKVKQNTYHIVLMDLQMPVMDGYHATLELRKFDTKIPIIALTAHALKEERMRCLANGFNEHITKPINSKNLIECIFKLATPSPPFA